MAVIYPYGNRYYNEATDADAAYAAAVTTLQSRGITIVNGGYDQRIEDVGDGNSVITGYRIWLDVTGGGRDDLYDPMGGAGEAERQRLEAEAAAKAAEEERKRQKEQAAGGSSSALWWGLGIATVAVVAGVIVLVGRKE